MAKDPRFNFYPDNWIGGTEGFTLEQEGAYLSLIILQSKVGRFTTQQAVDKLMQKTRGDAAACAGLWQFLMPKFENDGKVYWSERLEKEVAKSRHHSENQSKRAKKRYSQPKFDFGSKSGAAAAPASTQAMPVNGSGNGNGIENKKEQVAEEDEEYDKALELWTQDALDGNDLDLATMESREPKESGIPWPPGFSRTVAILDHRDMARRYEWRFETQRAFRSSLLKVMRDLRDKKTGKANGNKHSNNTENLVRAHNERWGR